jgi:hypothetical protein
LKHENDGISGKKEKQYEERDDDRNGTMVMAALMLCGEAKGQTPPVPSEEQPEVLTRGR